MWNPLWTKLFGDFLITFGVILDQLFDHFWDHFWEPFWGQLWDHIGQRGGKMSPREPSGASKNQKAAFLKTSKNLTFLKVFGSGGLPREPQETQEGSQEEPKELQNPQQKDQKLSPKINNFLINFGQIFGIKNAQKITQEIPKIKKQIKQMNFYKTQVDQHKKKKI